MTGGKVSAHQQDCFTRHGQSGIFQHYTEENGPVSVNQHVMLYEFERVMKEIHYRQAARNVRSDSNLAVRDGQGWIRMRRRLKCERLSTSDSSCRLIN